VAEEPTRKEEDFGGRKTRQRRLIFLAATALTIAAVIVVVVVTQQHDSGTGPTAGTDGSVTGVTSPYDLHELPAGTEPGDVERASLVSISLPGDRLLRTQRGQPRGQGSHTSGLGSRRGRRLRGPDGRDLEHVDRRAGGHRPHSHLPLPRPQHAGFRPLPRAGHHRAGRPFLAGGRRPDGTGASCRLREQATVGPGGSAAF
jgi:hypothetical protein